MRQAVVYDANDIKRLLAEKHGVNTEDVIKNQYSYTVIIEKKEDKDSE